LAFGSNGDVIYMAGIF